MRMRQILGSALVALLALTGIQAQTTQARATTPTALMERAEQALYRQGATTLDFSTQQKDKAGRTQADVSGKMYLQGDAFRLEYGTITAVYASGTLAYYDSAEQTLTYQHPSDEELLQINPLYILRSRAKGFQSKLQGTTATHATVLLTPTNKKANITQVQAAFQSANGLPAQLIFSARDRSVLTARISRVTHRAAYPASFFQLTEKDYPRAEVVDLR